ncbi:S-layer homology domain-containing protein [Phosphitispora fastidiosa]|uniref:S-layer homology domain-containing protein n=1 Tax=Phosphitispora fastidiosa TaxID=2837202 RepID=UPI001E3D764B|nr:S-layer homology domain-containing protein [Phosphitispora fastidiosa]MBU7005974.1 hypothetical protein [Phosphitispora fastidiosa]
MAMIDRASEITGLQYQANAQESENLLAEYNDSHKSADWAKTSIAKCLKMGIVSGRDDKTLAPKDKITRAGILFWGGIACLTKR